MTIRISWGFFCHEDTDWRTLGRTDCGQLQILQNGGGGSINNQ